MGCFFEVRNDPYETMDLAQESASQEALQIVRQRILQLQPSIFLPDRGSADPRACDQVAANGGYYGPWL